MIRRIYLSIFFFFFVFSSVFAEEVNLDKMFFDANNFYKDGMYAEAIKNYETIIQHGVFSGALYYNLGNAYFKQNTLGKALLNYERALKYIPKDEDLFANMRLVQSMLTEEQPSIEYAWYEDIFRNVRDSLSTNGWFLLSGFIYVLFFVGLTLFVSFEQLKPHKIKYIIYGVLLLVILTTLQIAKILDEKKNIPAMVIANEAIVRYSPSYSGSVVFKIHEGVKGQVIQRQGDWTQFRISKGKMGWVETHLIESI